MPHAFVQSEQIWAVVSPVEFVWKKTQVAIFGLFGLY